MKARSSNAAQLPFSLSLKKLFISISIKFLSFYNFSSSNSETTLIMSVNQKLLCNIDKTL